MSKRFLVDILSLNLFIICTAFIVEVVVSGIPFDIFWKGRLIMIIPNIITVEPYSRTRTWLGAGLHWIKSKHLKQLVRDTLVFVLYRVPLVFIVLTLLGASVEKVVSACIVATVVSGFTGRPYGIFLDWMRKLFAVK
jgi:hypothetical protein